MLQGKNILLGISASIAAYKSAMLCRLLVKEGANVKVLMTPDSVNFITPLTLSTLSKNPVYSQYFDSNSGEWSNHVELAKWADFFILAPATANTIAKMANGICDNLLLATYFSMENPVFFAPAMDLDMFQHPASKSNIQKLISYGNKLIPAGKGELASGLYGEGRMAEVEEILNAVASKHSFWNNRKILISAGPTYEPIDPVRFIGNHSSGKMGIAIANAALQLGADVTLVHGPVSIDLPIRSKNIGVNTASEMYDACISNSKEAEVIIMSAAVADFTPNTKFEQKIKQKETELNIQLKPTKDILFELGRLKTKKQFLVGFALETNDEINHAKGKLERKNLDLIVLNSLNDKGAGFGTDTNKISIINKDNIVQTFELKSKKELAFDILKMIENRGLKS